MGQDGQEFIKLCYSLFGYGCYRKGGNLCEVSMLLSKSLERQTAEACLLTALPSAGATNPLFEIESAQCSLVFATKAQLFPVAMLFCLAFFL